MLYDDALFPGFMRHHYMARPGHLPHPMHRQQGLSLHEHMGMHSPNSQHPQSIAELENHLRKTHDGQIPPNFTMPPGEFSNLICGNKIFIGTQICYQYFKIFREIL